VRATRGLVDGLGAARVAAVLSLAVEPKLTLRPIAASDEALILAWANDPEARRRGFQTKPITPRDHHAWFTKRLANQEDCVFLVAESEAGTPVGQVRFDRNGALWTISYALDAALRGWKLARPLLAAGIEALRAREPGAPLEAWVKPDNVASLQTFRGMGFAESLAERDGLQCHRFEQ
jgi:RimJ/RimL family protein N-acetyltransferase